MDFNLHWKDKAARLHFLKCKYNLVTALLKTAHLFTCILHPCSSSGHTDFLSVSVVLSKFFPAAGSLNKLLLFAKLTLHHAGLFVISSVRLSLATLSKSVSLNQMPAPWQLLSTLLLFIFNGALIQF